MPVDIYSSFFIQMILFVLLAFALLLSALSLFVNPAKRTIRASLVDKTNGHITDISLAETSIGRAKACDMVIPVMSVSRFHAVLSKRKAGWMIFDTNSTSGVVVNGKKIEKSAFLNDGDILSFGNTEYYFYSTAVTTRQQIVKKSIPVRDDDRVRYRKRGSKQQIQREDNSRPEYIKNEKSVGKSRNSKNQG